MKFTEEQYQKIVDVADKYIKKSGWGLIGTNLDQPIGSVFEETDLMHQVEFQYVNQEMMAIANPLTREWAHDKFVEKEKKYYWTNKKGNKLALYETDGIIVLKERYWAPLTESEIKAWGYNPNAFDREEV